MFESLAIDSDEARIGRAWRELNRGAGLQALRQFLFAPLLEAAQVDALDVLNAGGPRRMSDFAEALGVDASTATRTVSRLEHGGYVRRTRAPGDGRGVQVELTAAGLDKVRELTRRRTDLLLGSLDQMDDEDRATFADLFERFVVGVEAYATSAMRDSHEIPVDLPLRDPTARR